MAEWKGELRLAFVDEDRVTFYTHPDDPRMELEHGKRYAAVLIEIAENETLNPAASERRSVTKPTRSPSNVAAILCKDPAFQSWASSMLAKEGRGKFQASEEAATQFLYFRCAITSRAELDVNPVALRLFQDEVEVPYYRWVRPKR